MDQANTNKSAQFPKVYYNGKRRKVTDFLLGLIGVTLAVYFLWWLSGDIGDRILLGQSSEFRTNYNYLSIFVILIAYVMAAWRFLEMKRKFIFIGMITPILLPFLAVALVFGSCFMMR